MKQQDMYKILAFFLAFTMIFSIFAYIFINPQDNTQQQTEDQTQTYYDPEFWTFDQPFDSISDALNITPSGAESASYVNLEKMAPQMAAWARQAQPVLNEVDTIYNSTTTKMYYSDIKSSGNFSFLLLSTMDPLKNDFQYIFIDSYYDHPLLVRQEGGLQGFYNVMGTPVILAPPRTVIDVIDITMSLNETVTSYDEYKGMLNLVPYAPFQTITSNVTFAKQFYMGVDQNNESYERTTGYLDVNSSVMKKLSQLKTNSTQKRFSQYNITKTGNYTIVKVSGQDMYTVLMEEVN